jgi:hypothetical protein
MAERVLVAEKPAGSAQKAVLAPSSDAALWVLSWVGWLLGLAGWADVVLLWVPLHMGRPEWEFGTASATFDALPLATLGIGVLLAASLARGWKKAAVVGAGASLVVALVLLAVLVLFVLDVPMAWKGVGEQFRSQLVKATVKTAFMGVLYISLYAVAGWFTLRRVARARRAEREGT